MKGLRGEIQLDAALAAQELVKARTELDETERSLKEAASLRDGIVRRTEAIVERISAAGVGRNIRRRVWHVGRSSVVLECRDDQTTHVYVVEAEVEA